MPEKPREIDMGEILRKAKETVDRSLEETGEKNGKHDTKVPCIISQCTGTIMRERREEYRGSPRDFLIGGRNRMTVIVELYCSHCGISYHHLPRTSQESIG